MTISRTAEAVLSAANSPVVHRDPAQHHPSLAATLDAARDYLKTFIYFDSEHYAAVLALWAAHTYRFSDFRYTPYIFFVSAVKRSGKTFAMELLGSLSQNFLDVLAPTGPVLFRSIEAYRPTLALDEVDQLYRKKSEDVSDLTQVLNGGFKRGSRVTRLTGPKHEVKSFSVFCPKMLAGIRETSLPDPLRDRCVLIRMQRHPDKPPRYRSSAEEPRQREIAESLCFWMDNAKLSEPAIPEELGHREADVWEPLLSIADAAGDHWPETARNAAMSICADTSDDNEPVPIRLLADIRVVFEAESAEFLSSQTIVSRLRDLPEAPWEGWNYTTKKLASILHDFNVKPTKTRVAGVEQRGYRRSDFETAWATYLRESGGSDGNEHEQQEFDFLDEYAGEEAA